MIGLSYLGFSQDKLEDCHNDNNACWMHVPIIKQQTDVKNGRQVTWITRNIDWSDMATRQKVLASTKRW